MTSPPAHRDAAIDISVIVLTYNHEPFIEQALDSVLSQDVAANVEVLISEDRSTDGTRDVVRRYAERYPDRIRLFLSDENRNDGEVFARAYRAARGEFVAYLDGDDHWKPGKLAKQLLVMRSRPDVSLCYHDVEILTDPDAPSGRRHAYGPYRGFDALLRSNCIASGSTLFRRELVPDVPDWFHDVTFGDWTMAVLFASRGDVAYLDERLSVYRDHGGGMYSSATERQRRAWHVDFSKAIHANLDRCRAQTRLGLASARYRLAHAYADEGARWPAVRETLRSLITLPRHSELPAAVRLRLLARTLVPRLYAAQRSLRRADGRSTADARTSRG